MEALEAQEKYRLLAENEWRMRSLRKQQEYNNAVMKEQHRLNKRVVIIAAAISALAGLFGGVIGGYTQYLLGKTQQENCIERMRDIRPTTQATKPLKEPRDAATKQEDVSSKPPPVSQNDKNR